METSYIDGAEKQGVSVGSFPREVEYFDEGGN